MAFEVEAGQDYPFQASANVTALTYTGNPPVYASGGIPQFAAVVYDTATGNESDVTMPAAAGAQAIGIAQDAPASGPQQSVRVRSAGISKAIAAGAITVGQMVYVANAQGQLGVAPAAGATNTYATGYAETPAAQAGDLFSVRLVPGLTTQVNA